MKITFVVEGNHFSPFVSEVESDLPDDIKERCVLCFQSCLAQHMNIGDAIKKVQSEPLKEIDERYKGQRFKGFIKFDYDTNVVTIQREQVWRWQQPVQLRNWNQEGLCTRSHSWASCLIPT